MAGWLARGTRAGDPARSLGGAGRLIVGVLARRRPVVDPFETLEVQMSLSRLDREIETLRRSGDRFAAAHHLRAAVIAYDDLLAQACRLAGVVGPVPVRSALHRLAAEAELHARGWDW